MNTPPAAHRLAAPNAPHRPTINRRFEGVEPRQLHFPDRLLTTDILTEEQESDLLAELIRIMNRPLR